MPAEESSRDIVVEILAKELDRTPEAVRAATSFDMLDIDSMDMVQVVMSLEDRLAITIPDRDLQAVQSLNDMVTLVDRLRNDGDPAAVTDSPPLA